MKMQDIIIRKVFFCKFDREAEVVPYSEHTLGTEDALYRYVTQMITKYYFHETSRRAYIPQESDLLQILPEMSDQFEPFVNYVCDTIQDLMKEHQEIQDGAGIFIWAVINDQEHIAFFKSDYQIRFGLEQDEDGTITMRQNGFVLPGPSPKIKEYFFINMNENQAQIADYDCLFEGNKVNYLADVVLRLVVKQSEAVTVKAIDESVVETIKTCFEDEAPQKIMEYKTIVADQVKEKGQINVAELGASVFKDDEKAVAVYQEVIEQNDVPLAPVYVSKKTERKMQKKQKLVTDAGIEILVPIDILRDDSVFEYHQNDDGKISIIIKEIMAIENK